MSGGAGRTAWPDGRGHGHPGARAGTDTTPARTGVPAPAFGQGRPCKDGLGSGHAEQDEPSGAV